MASKASKATENETTKEGVARKDGTSADRERCGIVMPISATDGCSEAHWAEVRGILNDAITAAGFEPGLVSDADDVGIIQKRIITRLYEDPIVVCDVSGKNSNVMFELGIRLAFDKPTIIVKDDKTGYSFDTAPIEHLGYPRDLRFGQIVAFKQQVTEKVKATHDKARNDPDYTTFLKHFGKFVVAKLETKEVSKEEFVIHEIATLRRNMDVLMTNIYQMDNGARSSEVRHSIREFLERYYPAKDWPGVNIEQLVGEALHELLKDGLSDRISRDDLRRLIVQMVDREHRAGWRLGYPPGYGATTTTPPPQP